jgi:hypothetical protein
MKHRPVPTPTLLACKCKPGVGFHHLITHPHSLANTSRGWLYSPPPPRHHHVAHHVTHVTHVTTMPPTSPCRPPRHHGSTTPTTATKNDEGPKSSWPASRRLIPEPLPHGYTYPS